MSEQSVFAVIVVSIVVFQQCIHLSQAQAIPNWDDHDVSTLRLLQIVHRHGERTALKDSIPTTDPFKAPDNWPEGYGGLTNAGKYRMYRMGQYLRQNYDRYLGADHSPRHVYARSSVEHRCIESVSCLLSGLYPANGDWRWGDTLGEPPLSTLWQPFPIETFIPKDDDTLLVPHKKCPKATEEHEKISRSNDVMKIVSNFHMKNISSYLETLFNESVISLYRGQQFYDTLNIEAERGLKWPQFDGSHSDQPYTQQQILDTLREFSVGSYVYDWDREFIQRIRIGNLMKTLIDNMNARIDGAKSDVNRKLFVYSTHDTIVVPLLQSLKLYNNLIPAYGAAVIFELHERPSEVAVTTPTAPKSTMDNQQDKYLLKIYYYNDTLRAKPYLLSEQRFATFDSANRKWFYTDFDEECGLKSSQTMLMSEMVFMVMGVALGVFLLGLNIVIIRFIRSQKDKSSFTLTKDN